MPRSERDRRFVAITARALTLAVCVLFGRAAGAVDPFEIQVYDAAIDPPMKASVELHVNSVVSGVNSAPAPELPPDHQTHLTMEPSFGLARYWEVGGYFQSTIRGDGGLDCGFRRIVNARIGPS